MDPTRLHGRFCALANKLRVADADRADTHAVRIGRDPDDRWIQVLFKGDSAQFQRLREALVLTTIAARADCTAWRHELTETSRLVVPPDISLDDAPLAPRFVFAFDSMRDPSECAWSHLHPLVGDCGYGETFEDDIARISAFRGQLRPIPTQLVVEAASHWTLAQQLEMLRGLVGTIEHMQQIEDAYRHDMRSADGRRAPAFALDAIRLELGNLTFSSEVLDELRLLLETGVSVQSLVLPCAPGSLSSDACYSAHADAWSELSMAICRDQVHVKRLAVSVPHASSPFLTALLSALSHARTLSSLTIDVQREFRECDSAWPWLAFSLFSVVSTSSVEELHLENFELREDLEAFARIMASVDPIRELWSATIGAREPRSTSTQNGSILVRPGANFFVLGGGDRRFPVTISRASVGTLVRGDPTSRMLDVLLPGFGFGSIAHECVAFVNAEAPTASPPRHRLRTLVLDVHTSSLDVDDDDDDQQAERRHESEARAIQLVRLIGPDLSSLGLYAPFLDATSVDSILESCPHLTSVRLAAMALESLAFLSDAYERRRCRIASLHLYSVDMEPPALASFLQLLVVPNCAVQRTLKRLRFDEMWVYDLPLSIVSLLRQILSDPASLEHLHVVLNSPTQQEELASAPAATVPLPLPLANRLALLSALRRQAVNSAAHSLDPFVLTRVFQWAEAPTRRSFVFEIGVD